MINKNILIPKLIKSMSIDAFLMVGLFVFIFISLENKDVFRALFDAFLFILNLIRYNRKLKIWGYIISRENRYYLL